MLSVIMVTLLAIVALYWSDLQTYRVPDASKQRVVEGRVSGYPEIWKYNRSLVYFSVTYKLDGQQEGKRVYAYRAPYEQSGLRVNSKVLVTVEHAESGSRVRGLVTADGTVLYDDWLDRQVLAWNNRSVGATVVMGTVISILIAIVVLIMIVRNRREIFKPRLDRLA